MDAHVGLAAGDVYRFLAANGPASVSQLKKGTGHKDAIVNQAIGWLAREDKIVRETQGKTVRWSVARS
jgi:hypothetical protein